VARSGRCSGIPMEGGSGGVAASSSVVLWLEAEVREGTAGEASERRRKHSGGEKIPSATRGAKRGREGRPGRPASAPGERAQTRVTDRRDRATAGPVDSDGVRGERDNVTRHCRVAP
jgi:hypothetical protein